MNKKIVFITNMYPDKVDKVKGIFVDNIYKSFLDAGLSCDIVKLENSNGRFLKFLKYSKFYGHAINKIFHNIDATFYVHYVSHSSLPLLFFTLMLRKKLRIVAHVHGSDLLPESEGLITRLLKSMLTKQLLKNAQKVIVPSEYYRKVVSSMVHEVSSRVCVSPSGGIDLSVFTPKVSTRNEDKNQVLTLGFVGRLTKDKGILDYLHLCDELRQRGYKTRNLVVGDGPMREHIKDNSDLIEFLGPMQQSELPRIYRMFDIFVFPTLRLSESLGLVGLEAMACGVPVITYPGTGPSTYVSHRVNGYICAYGELEHAVLEYENASNITKQNMSRQAVLTASRFCKKEVSENLIKQFY